MGALLRVNPVATNDLLEIKEYISQDNPEAARRIVTEIVEAYESLVDFPEKGTRLSERIGRVTKYRYLVCRKYLIFYLYEDGVVSVHRVLHGSRDYPHLLPE